MKRWINEETESRFNAIWDLIEKEDGVSSLVDLRFLFGL